MRGASEAGNEGGIVANSQVERQSSIATGRLFPARFEHQRNRFRD